MLTVSEALDRIIRETKVFQPQEILLDQSLGLTLAETVFSDRNNPPFNKALMDGYAVRSIDLQAGQNSFRVIEEITAGNVPSRQISEGESSRIMTGAPLPLGADLVVPFEESECDESAGIVQLKASKKTPGSNMMPEGMVLKKGDTVLEKGTVLRFPELGSLAEVGKAKLKVINRPRIAVLATGDELVEVSAEPAEGQIRNSNVTMLAAQVENAGGIAEPLGIAKDIREEIESKIHKGLQSDILLLSGGVSAGKLDLVPDALKKCGVKEIFHKVKLKPGKPIWFGTYQKEGSDNSGDCCYVFGLPGNPVGSMICFELFVRTCIRLLMGKSPSVPESVKAKLNMPFTKKGDRELYYPCCFDNQSGENSISLFNWQGSADLQSTVNANAMAIFPIGNHEYQSGDRVDVIVW